jgi:hypothetical protein
VEYEKCVSFGERLVLKDGDLKRVRIYWEKKMRIR